ncbi:hypothetical protein ACUXCC_000300 [Cytobacillus horneckiae]|uniref:Uncharacterized protein n=1 Tax=Cytobacillus horneckiae TaxID=549687 RepID=A0A2N0ZFK1_9BACI|nr:hypothetical protein [Cytobacillus horneckiae]MBN6885170.1 hypothetical protein [Cytobacillus horneckiae]MCM3179079.1 hypothetical protein [Cytobacillus horneckiae]MEC1154303.1 hypothetical protein [Cytobacillus horneckiae]MED2937639.1 hypothetical protein [Cytobacillus horneckiae]PKG28289.1 hypothetical protein CWS20_13840 [Cytobacillus horneckiae]
MNSETYLDFCFIREASGDFSSEINQILSTLFDGIRLHWYLDEKSDDGMDVVVAEVKGMSKWQSEEETIDFIEEHATQSFWDYLQGFQFIVYPPKRGCGSCGNQ